MCCILHYLEVMYDVVRDYFSSNTEPYAFVYWFTH